MILDNVMLNNIDDVIQTPQGVRLLRYKQNVIKALNPHARYMAHYCCGAEIRFVTDSPRVNVNLLSEEGSAKVVIYYGDYCVREENIEKGKVTELALTVPQIVNNLPDDKCRGNLFKRGVWRLHFHNSIMTLCSIDSFGYALRPPKKEELPSRTMLSYGSSISHGAGSCFNPMTYVNNLASLLRVDCLPKGVGGSCFLEKEIADDFAGRDDWDFALLELGVNMAGEFTPEEFKARFDYFADKMYKTGKKLIFVTIFPNSRYYALTDAGKNMIRFNEIIREKVSDFDKERVILVEGDEVLTHSEMLSADGIHPSTEGHIEMSLNLFGKVKDFVNK